MEGLSALINDIVMISRFTMRLLKQISQQHIGSIC